MGHTYTGTRPAPTRQRRSTSRRSKTVGTRRRTTASSSCRPTSGWRSSQGPTRSSHNHIGHNYIGHNYICRNYIAHDYKGHDYTGHNHINHNDIGPNHIGHNYIRRRIIAAGSICRCRTPTCRWAYHTSTGAASAAATRCSTRTASTSSPA